MTVQNQFQNRVTNRSNGRLLCFFLCECSCALELDLKQYSDSYHAVGGELFFVNVTSTGILKKEVAIG